MRIILTQNKRNIVIANKVTNICSIYMPAENSADEKPQRILAYFAADEDFCELGEYTTESNRQRALQGLQNWLTTRPMSVFGSDECPEYKNYMTFQMPANGETPNQQDNGQI